ncbi:MAG TPA: D-TA family PLP-dependent enzyme [Calditrichaeota bacterium]|nr:D-TA family PLP-dependent enzyme [Calditrichota bacterium]
MDQSNLLITPDIMPFSATALKELHKRIDTPALLIVEERLQANIEAMQRLARGNQCRLRPHIKTHKSTELAKRQLTAGAVGIAVAKLGEAEVMQDAGIDDIFIANQIAHPIKIKHLLALHKKGRIILGLDHPRQIDLLRDVFQTQNKPLEVRIEIDSGLKRCGVSSKKELLLLAKQVIKQPWLRLEGIFTHAGQAYGATSPHEIATVGRREGEVMADATNWLKEEAISIETVSVGSTPTAPFSAQNEMVNEIRPGNYVFYDGIQTALGVCGSKQCALFVLATVISHPEINRIVVDAGSKALNLDRGAHAQAVLNGYGTLVNRPGVITRVSEEHGVVQISSESAIQVGDPLLILPNHACTVANLYEKYYLADKNLHLKEIAVSARGRSQ